MGKRNAHAYAAKFRRAGPHGEHERDACHICGKDMGYAPPSYICAECEIVYWERDEEEDE